MSKIKDAVEVAKSAFPKTKARLDRFRDNKIKPMVEKLDNRLGETKTSKEFNNASNPDIDIVKNNQEKENAKKKSIQAQNRIEAQRQSKNSPMKIVEKPAKRRNSIQQVEVKTKSNPDQNNAFDKATPEKSNLKQSSTSSKQGLAKVAQVKTHKSNNAIRGKTK